MNNNDLLEEFNDMFNEKKSEEEKTDKKPKKEKNTQNVNKDNVVKKENTKKKDKIEELFEEQEKKNKNAKKPKKTKKSVKHTKKDYTGYKVIVYGDELWIVDNKDTTLEQIREKIEKEFDYPNFTPSKTYMSVDEEYKIITPVNKFQNKG